MIRIDPAERRARLWARHHLGRTASDPTRAVADLVAMHSSDPLTPHLGLWARVPGYRPDQLHAALDVARTLWRLHAVRRTLWVVPAGEAAVFDAAAGRKIAAAERARLLGWTLAIRPDAARWLEALEVAVLGAVGASPGIGTRQLSAALPDLGTKLVLGAGKWSTEAAVGSRFLFVLAMELKLARAAPSGTWRSSQYGWVLADRWYGPRSPVEEAEARAGLVRRYLERFGPVTTTDVKWWGGFTVAQTRAALAAAGAEVVSVDGGEAWVRSGDVERTPEASGVALLPGLDPTPMGTKERAFFLGPHEAALFDRNGNVGPTVWADGRVVGGWAVRGDGEVRVKVLEDVGREAELAIDAEAARLSAWLEGGGVTPRFRTPLERGLC